jgi:hypothetical protein
VRNQGIYPKDILSCLFQHGYNKESVFSCRSPVIDSRYRGRACVCVRVCVLRGVGWGGDNTPLSYFGGPGFKSRPGGWLSSVRPFAPFLRDKRRDPPSDTSLQADSSVIILQF